MSDFNPQQDSAEPSRSLVASDLKELLDRPIAYHRIFARVGGGPLAGIFLSQAIYWSQRTADPGGWFYKTRADWFLETELTRRHQETARRNLRDAGILQEQLRGVPAQLYYRVDLEQLQRLITHLLDGKKGVPASRAESAQQEGTKAPSKKGASAPAIQSETSTETSTETSSINDDDDSLNYLVQHAVQIGANRKRAQSVIAASRDEAARQLEYFPHRKDIQNPGGAILTAIEQSWPPPPAFQAIENERKERAARALAVQREKDTKAAAQAEEKRREQENEMLDAEWKKLPAPIQDEIMGQARNRCAPIAALGRIPVAALQAARRNIQRAEMGLPVED